MAERSYLQADGGNTVRKSVADLSTWVSKSLPITGAFRWVVSDQRDVAVVLADKADPAICYSTDQGEIWSSANLGASTGNAPRGVWRLGDYFVAVDDDGHVYVAGIGTPASWTKYNKTSGGTFNASASSMGAAWRRSTNTAIIMGSAVTANIFQRSVGVASWGGAWVNAGYLGHVAALHCINDSTFVAVGVRVGYSTDDGQTWSSDGTTYNFRASVLVEGGSKIVAIDTSGNIWSTTNGINWSDSGFNAPYNPLVQTPYSGQQRAVWTDADGIVAVLDSGGVLVQSSDLGENWNTFSSVSFAHSICLIDVPIEPITGETDENGTVDLPDIEQALTWDLCIQKTAQCDPVCVEITIPPPDNMGITGPDGEAELTLAAGDYMLSVQPFGCETPYTEEVMLS